MSKSAEEIKNAVREAEKDGKLSCTRARRLAEELGVPAKDIGQAANELEIKLFGCELGCF